MIGRHGYIQNEFMEVNKLYTPVTGEFFFYFDCDVLSMFGIRAWPMPDH